VLNVIGDVAANGQSSSTTRSDTAGTLIQIVDALQREGVTELYACATHAVLSVRRSRRIGGIEPALRSSSRTPIRFRPRSARQGQGVTLAPAHLPRLVVRIHQAKSVGALFTSEVQARKRCSCGTWTAHRATGTRGNGRSMEEQTADAAGRDDRAIDASEEARTSESQEP